MLNNPDSWIKIVDAKENFRLESASKRNSVRGPLSCSSPWSESTSRFEKKNHSAGRDRTPIKSKFSKPCLNPLSHQGGPTTTFFTHLYFPSHMVILLKDLPNNWPPRSPTASSPIHPSSLCFILFFCMKNLDKSRDHEAAEANKVHGELETRSLVKISCKWF